MAILNHTSTSVETEPRKLPEKPAKPPTEETARPPLGRWTRRDTFLLLLVLLLAGGVRIVRLAEPNAVVFDETYYAKDACLYLGHTQQFCGLEQATEQSYVHPPLGKWLISLGIGAFGYNSFGWRFSAAVVGTALAGLAYLFARSLFEDRWTAAVTGLFAASDLLLIVQSRTAMLDIFLSFFILLGFWFLVLDRRQVLLVKDSLRPSTETPDKDSPSPAGPPAEKERIQVDGAAEVSEAEGPAAADGRRRQSPSLPAEKERPDSAEASSLVTTAIPGRPPAPATPVAKGGRTAEHEVKRLLRWRLAAGVAFGAALAVKWSALLALAAAAICCLFWSLELLIAARKQRSSFYGPPKGASLTRELLITGSAFVLIPLLLYLAAYSAYFVDRVGKECPFSVPERGERLLDAGLLGQPAGKCITGVPGTVLSFIDLQDRMLDYHAHLTAKHTYQSKAWSWPLVLRPVAYFYESKGGKAAEVMAVGSVATWYGALVCLFWLVRRSFGKWRPERIVLGAWLAQYLPWLLVPRPLFLFYMAPAVPFMMAGLAAALAALRRQGRFGRISVAVFLLLAAVVFVALYPLVSAISLPQSWWQRLMWVPQFDCGGFMCGWI